PPTPRTHPHRWRGQPRSGNREHGELPQDVGPEPVPAVARREEPVRGGRQQPRQRLVPEPDVDDHGPRLALLRSPGRRAGEGEPVKREDQAGLTRRHALKLTAGAALSVPVLFTRAMAAPAT